MTQPGEAPAERPNSVEISFSTKGELSFKVKAYADDIDEAVAAAQAKAAEMIDWRNNEQSRQNS